MMKNIFAGLYLFVLGFAVAIPASAQDAYLELVRSDLKADRVALVTVTMGFTDAEAEIFWPIYREYEFDRDKLGDEKISIINDYAENYETMTDEVAQELMERVFKTEENQIKLQKKYFKKMQKALPATIAAKFFHLERQIILRINLQIAAELPLLETGS